MQVVRRTDFHCIHLRAGQQLPIIRKTALRRQAEFVAGLFQPLRVNVTDGRDLSIGVLQQARHMSTHGNAAHANDSNTNFFHRKNSLILYYFASSGSLWP